jgi:TRAP-type C4-dicarboxylate transport system permease small subunit
MTRKKALPHRWWALSWPSLIVLSAGLASAVYGPLLSHSFETQDNTATGGFVFWSTFAGIAVAGLTALQIQCMITGGCVAAAWVYAVLAFCACMMYLRIITRMAANRTVSPQLASNPAYNLYLSIKQQQQGP